MAGKKTLTNIVLAGTLSLATGCSYRNNPEYNFKGDIGEDHVEFYEDNNLLYCCSNHLSVTKADGSIIVYIDTYDDHILDVVKITVGENTTTYSSDSLNPVVKDVLQKAQTEFDYYLSKIIEIQTAPLNRN